MKVMRDTHDIKMRDKERKAYKEMLWNPPLEELDDGKNQKLASFDLVQISGA